jgi:chemotaxis signal transduction protein
MNVGVRPTTHARRDRRPEQVILFSVARRTFAIAAEAVKEIRSTDSIAGIAVDFDSSAIPKVRHLIPRGHRTYYVVSGCAHFHLPTTRPTLALILRQFRGAVLVDAVERMAEIPVVYPLPRAFRGEERTWYRGLAYLEEHIVPVVNPGGFLTREQCEQLDRLAPPVDLEPQPEGPLVA